jgi:predicted RNA-binding protein with PIN domain
MRYIVDGYNLIFRIFDLSFEKLELQREQVVPYLWDLFIGTSHHIDIVFDSHPEHFFSQSVQRNPPFHLLFSPPPLSADAFILEMCHGITKKGEVVVVSSDKFLTRQVQELQFKTLTVEDFLKNFRRQSRKGRSFEKPSFDPKSEKTARYLELFEKRSHDPMTFEDL